VRDPADEVGGMPHASRDADLAPGHDDAVDGTIEAMRAGEDYCGTDQRRGTATDLGEGGDERWRRFVPADDRQDPKREAEGTHLSRRGRLIPSRWRPRS
jgi:hypothetical protein